MIEKSIQPVQYKGEFVLTKTGNIGQNGSLILVKSYTDKNHIAIVKLTPSKNNDFYDVQTGYPSRKSGKNKKPLLWERQEERL